MSDSRLTRIQDHEISERWRSIAYLAGLATAGTICVVALVAAIIIVAQLLG